MEAHKIFGVDVRVHSSAKTLADCFKFRNKIGLDVAIKALRGCMRAGKATFDDLGRAAKVCRVANIMQQSQAFTYHWAPAGPWQPGQGSLDS